MAKTGNQLLAEALAAARECAVDNIIYSKNRILNRSNKRC